MSRRRYQLSIRQIMLLILLAAIWMQTSVSFRAYKRRVRQELFVDSLYTIDSGLMEWPDDQPIIYNSDGILCNILEKPNPD